MLCGFSAFAVLSVLKLFFGVIPSVFETCSYLVEGVLISLNHMMRFQVFV